MFSSKALAVFLILCATVSAAPVERRSVDDGLERLQARGPQDHTGGTHPHPAPAHQAHASTSQPIAVPHANHPSGSGHSPSSSHYGTPNQSPHGSPARSHSGHESDHGGHSGNHSPVSSSGSFHSAHSSHSPPHTPPHPNQHLIDAVHASGSKISAKDVVHIWQLGRPIPRVNSQHAWLETGNDRSGMQHIVNKHGPAFAQQGIPHDQLPHLAEQATKHGEIMGTQGRSRTIYKTDHQGSTHHVAVETASNGYVVSMNPSSESSAKKAAAKWKAELAKQQAQPGPSSGTPGASTSGGGN